MASQTKWYALQVTVVAIVFAALVVMIHPTVTDQDGRPGTIAPYVLLIWGLVIAWGITWTIVRLLDWWRHGTWLTAIRWCLPRALVATSLYSLVQASSPFHDWLPNTLLTAYWLTIVATAFYGSQWLIDAGLAWWQRRLPHSQRPIDKGSAQFWVGHPSRGRENLIS